MGHIIYISTKNVALVQYRFTHNNTYGQLTFHFACYIHQ